MFFIVLGGMISIPHFVYCGFPVWIAIFEYPCFVFSSFSIIEKFGCTLSICLIAYFIMSMIICGAFLINEISSIKISKCKRKPK